MNKDILNSDVQSFIKDNTNADVAKISLGKSPFPNVSPRELAEQIDSRRRSKSKLPLWHNTTGIYFPPKLAIEQCSSENTARYKAELINGIHIADLTGGLGVDTAFFAKKADHVVHCEVNSELSAISEYNSRVLGLNIQYINQDGINWLKESDQQFDTIYIDPSRRISSSKVFMLKDCEPDVGHHLHMLLAHTRRLVIKTAPLLDIHSTINELGSVNEVHVLSVKNDCKEVLYVIDNESDVDEPVVSPVILNNENIETFSFKFSDERSLLLTNYSKPLNYVYEPDVALLKAGCFKLITKVFKVQKLHQHTHMYTSDVLSADFMGRKFEVKNYWEYGTFIKTQSFRKANIICRNFPTDPEKLKKKLKISDGGDDYLLFCTGSDNELLVIHGERLA